MYARVHVVESGFRPLKQQYKTGYLYIAFLQCLKFELQDDPIFTILKVGQSKEKTE